MERETERMRMRIYICGPMTGLPNNNFPAFNAAARRLRDEGHFVINPVELSAMFGTPDELADSFAAYYDPSGCSGDDDGIAENVMAADLAALRSCDTILLLKGWENSRGARTELRVAIEHRLQIMLEDAKRAGRRATVGEVKP